jgi:hypothetical protein
MRIEKSKKICGTLWDGFLLNRLSRVVAGKSHLRGEKIDNTKDRLFIDGKEFCNQHTASSYLASSVFFDEFSRSG